MPYPYSARSKVHEYGGGSYCFGDNTLYFCEASDQQIYALPLDGSEQIKKITDLPQSRFADLIWDAVRERIIAVHEYHHSDHKVDNNLVAIELNGKLSVLAEGDDFYAYPRLNASATKLTWISWNHPHMPWDATQLWTANIDTHGQLTNSLTFDGGDTNSLLQPAWGKDDTLFFVSDNDNWWNLYCVPVTDETTQLRWQNCRQITQLEAEFATPLWVFAMQNYAIIDTNFIVASYTKEGRWHLCRIDIATGSMTQIDEPCSSLSYLQAEGEKVTFIRGTATKFQHLCLLTHSVVKPVFEQPDDDIEEVSRAQAIRFATTLDEFAYAFFYRPCNTNYECDGPPPAIVICHGGPTGQTDDTLNNKIQFWTSRGFAVIDVNYRGSTGFGRHYRQRLNRQWGVFDVEDIVKAVDYLVSKKEIDPNKVVVKGSSAGGFTVLAALAFTDRFSAGVSLYGIGDLELLASDTHKFEARYLDSLVGAYPSEKSVYQQRSPINAVGQLNCPLLLLQGLEDKVVPPNQARRMAECVRNKGLPVALVEFPDEGHGFRAGATIKKMLDAELYFYQCIFELENTFESAPMTIENI